MDKKKQQPEFEKVIKPVIKYIRTSLNPHATIIIDCNHAEVLHGVECFAIDEKVDSES